MQLKSDKWSPFVVSSQRVRTMQQCNRRKIRKSRIGNKLITWYRKPFEFLHTHLSHICILPMVAAVGGRGPESKGRSGNEPGIGSLRTHNISVISITLNIINSKIFNYLQTAGPSSRFPLSSVISLAIDRGTVLKVSTCLLRPR